MNIFVTSSATSEAARDLDDLRLNKMIVETTQMLAVALTRHGCPKERLPKKVDGTPFKGTGWEKHPCTVWAGDNKGNFTWLVIYLYDLCYEYRYRFSKEHRLSKNVAVLNAGTRYLPDGKRTTWANCSLFPDNPNVIEAYRATMAHKWRHDKKPPKWTNRKPPEWLDEFTLHLDRLLLEQEQSSRS